MNQGSEKTVYFTIVRDPVSLFVSLWDYFDIPHGMFKLQKVMNRKMTC